MTVNDLVDQLGMQVAAGADGLNNEVQGGYSGDLLSDVMGNAPMGCVWLTIQGHQNIVAVAVLRDMSAIILTGGKNPDDETLKNADEENVPILLSPDSSFMLAGKLIAMGIGS